MIPSTVPQKRYRIRHETKFEYSSPVSLCHNTMRLAPREMVYQTVEHAFIEISPKPASRSPRIDHHGNRSEYFSIESQHEEMVVRAESVVRRGLPLVNIPTHIDFGEVRGRLGSPLTLEDRLAQEYCFDSSYIAADPAFSEFAIESFRNRTNLFESVFDLMSRIFREFKYSPNSTHVSTTPHEVLKSRKGVCQDFAHLQIACLRSLGLAARYVSGYLLTHPAPGQPKLIGADASHAWVSVYFADAGWIDFDPTNNQIPTDEHITLAWGADYADVAPIAGTLIGGGATTLSVSVDVAPVDC